MRRCKTCGAHELDCECSKPSNTHATSLTDYQTKNGEEDQE